MMKKVSFKGLRLSFTRKPRDKGREKSPANDGSRETNSDTSNLGDQNLSSQDSTCQTRHSRIDPANPGEILIPTRKEKKGLFGNLGKKLRNSFYRKQIDTTIVVDENIGTSPTSDTTNRRKKRKPKHVNPRGIIRPIDKPLSSTTSDEASDGVSGLSVQIPHRTRHSKPSYSALEKRETHSSCSSDSCEHDNCISRCSKVSVNVHTCDNKEHSSTSQSGGSLNSANAVASGINTSSNNDQQSPKNISPQPGARSLRQSVPNCYSNYSDPNVLETNNENKSPPAIPPRPDVLPVPGRNSLSMVLAHRGLSFGLGGAFSLGALGGEDFDYHNSFYDEVRDAPKMWSLTKELLKLSRYGWYWGPLTRIEAEDKLAMQPNGAFLVRDSSDDRYLLSLSFRSNERTLHTRIEHCNGMFSFYAQPELEGYPSIVDLIEHSMNDSLAGVFCYSRARTPGEPSFPVRLTKPVSRFTQVRSLQYLCRFVIRQYTRLDHIQKLPLPPRLKGWLEQNQY